MVETLFVTLLPALFLSVLIGTGVVFRRRNMDVDGRPPINKTLFVSSKWAIALLWATTAMQAWGLRLFPLVGPPVLENVALGLWALGFLLLFTGRFGLGDSFRIGSPKDETGLKTAGLFCISRNPMYVGVSSTLLATVLYTLNPLALAIAIYIVAIHHRILLAEEAHLRTVFDEEHADHCRQVRRYL